MTTAYLHFGFGDEPRQTVEVEHRTSTAPRAGMTQSGYGSRLPTEHEVKFEGRWRRVYAACFGNAASLYIGKPGAWIATFDR